jgi:hypothetical protein
MGPGSRSPFDIDPLRLGQAAISTKIAQLQVLFLGHQGKSFLASGLLKGTNGISSFQHVFLVGKSRLFEEAWGMQNFGKRARRLSPITA